MPALAAAAIAHPFIAAGAAGLGAGIFGSMMKKDKETSTSSSSTSTEAASATASKLEADAAAKASAETAEYNKRRKSQSTLLTSAQGLEESGKKKTLLG